MKTTIRLDAYNEPTYSRNDLSIIGIISREPGFMFAGRMNRKLRTDFEKSEDFSLWNEKGDPILLKTFYWHSETNGGRHILLETYETPSGTLGLSTAYDYLLIVFGLNNSAIAKELLRQLYKDDMIHFVQIVHDSNEAPHQENEAEEIPQFNLLGEVVKKKTSKARNKTQKPHSGISTKALDNFLFDLEDYMSALAKHKPTFDNPYI